jgi:hypothetical protein
LNIDSDEEYRKQVVAVEGYRRLTHIFLITKNPIGLIQNIGKPGMERFPGPALEPSYILIDKGIRYKPDNA